jgi:hypothetical protein
MAQNVFAQKLENCDDREQSSGKAGDHGRRPYQKGSATARCGRGGPANAICRDLDVHQMFNRGDEETSKLWPFRRVRGFNSLTAACRENSG